MNKFRINRCMLSDSYKYTHTKQYPENTVSMFDYAEARSAKEYPATVFVGLQYFLMKYFSEPIEEWEVHEAKTYAQYHGISFDYDGWMYIVKELNGKLPVEIKAVAEGSVVPTGNVLFTIESTDEEVFWIASWLETVLMNVWYPSNVATRSYSVRLLLEKYANKTQDNPNVAYQFYNFGARGATCPEASAIGGMAHLLTGFRGSDIFYAMKAMEVYYGPTEPTSSIEEHADRLKAFRSDIMHSIDATEHSSTTSWGRDGEFEMIMKHLDRSKGKPIIAAVLDSYDYFHAVGVICDQNGEFQKKINTDEYSMFVMRPDSGVPKKVLNKTLDIMEESGVPYTVNSKGYKVWKKMRIIWGDGINLKTMKKMLKLLKKRGYSSENITFGSGGWLMQEHSRDTQSWAIKCSEITLDEGSPIDTGHLKAFDGEDAQETTWEPHYVTRDVFKDPITAPNKQSKRGKLTLFYNTNTNEYFTAHPDTDVDTGVYDVLRVVYRNGEMTKYISLVEARERNAA